MLDLLATEARKIRSGGYVVRRGVIQWLSFDFRKHPLALAIVLDTGTIGRQDLQSGALALEFGGSMKMDEDSASLDDAILDDMYEDAEFLVRKLAEAKDERGNDVAIVRLPAEVVEWSDIRKRVGGIVVTFDVRY